jgi:hypothetical protein
LDVKKPRKTKMKKTTLEKFSVVAIAEQIGADGSDVCARFDVGHIREG